MVCTKKKYYHDTYFQKIIKLVEEYRLEEALNLFQQYFASYPNDISGYIYYLDTLIKVNKLEESERVLNDLEKLITQIPAKYNLETLIMIKTKLFCCQRKYQEGFEYLKANLVNIHEKSKLSSVNKFLVFFKKKLNILTSSDYKYNNYFLSQIVNYQDVRAITHIKEHREENSISQFLPDFPIENVYNSLREGGILSNTYRYIESGITDSYIFKYLANGYVNNKLVDYLEVITLQNSNDIITMYPYENRERREYIDITPEIEFSTLKHQRVSQIDKFNARYGKK